MSLKVSSSRHYCPGPGLINMSPVRSVYSLTFNDMLLFLSYFEHCCIMKKTLWEKRWLAGIANMSAIPKVIIPSFSWIMVFLWFLGTPLSCRVCTHPDVSLLQPLHPGDADDVRDPTLCQRVAIPAHLRCNPSRHIYSPE